MASPKIVVQALASETISTGVEAMQDFVMGTHGPLQGNNTMATALATTSTTSTAVQDKYVVNLGPENMTCKRTGEESMPQPPTIDLGG